jgi:ribose transport system ATP-binding protein
MTSPSGLAAELAPNCDDVAELPLIAFDAVCKRFGATVALDHVSLRGYAGSIHALTGENGAGKSTLMNLLAGLFRPDQGTVSLRRGELHLPSPSAARKSGISTVFQELTLMGNLDVAENLFLGHEPGRFGRLDRAAMCSRARKIMAQMGCEIDVTTRCDTLSVAEQQMVEIAKGISLDADVFIFDEPTAALNGPEVEKLGELLNRLRKDGKLAFYISHRLDEIFRFCDTVSVLKDGVHVATETIEALTPERLVSLMVGRDLGDLYPSRGAPGDEILTVEGLSIGDAGLTTSFSLRRGEILGLSGLEGQGQRDMIRALAGQAPSVTGCVTINGQRQRRKTDLALRPEVAARLGVGFIPEDRKTEGLYLALSIEQNVALGLYRERKLWSHAHLAKDVVLRFAKKMQIRTSSLDQPVGELSGGNQQKVMIGRWLASGVEILLIEEPTRGVDIGAKAEIYELLRDFVSAGGAVLMTSSELPEILGLCDRVKVVRNGAIVATLEADQVNEEEVMGYALGSSAPVEPRKATPCA